MNLIDRRSMMRSMLGGAAVAAAAATVTVSLIPTAVEAAPLPLDNLPARLDDLVRDAQAVVVGPRRRGRRRRWVCWWRRGRRVCGWRW
jgi:hypothetical protein